MKILLALQVIYNSEVKWDRPRLNLSRHLPQLFIIRETLLTLDSLVLHVLYHTFLCSFPDLFYCPRLFHWMPDGLWPTTSHHHWKAPFWSLHKSGRLAQLSHPEGRISAQPRHLSALPVAMMVRARQWNPTGLSLHTRFFLFSSPPVLVNNPAVLLRACG